MKKLLSVICKMLSLFVNTFTAYDKYSVLNREYLTHPIHMQLSQKQKKISQFFSAFLKCRVNFEHIKKEKNTLMACISEITDFQKRGYINSQKVTLQSTLVQATC